MEKAHKRILRITAVAVAMISFVCRFDYRDIASEGISLSSIVLAVYVASMMGFIGAKLGEKLANQPSQNPEYTQLWVLRTYFRNANVAAVMTIVASSIILLLPEYTEEVSPPLIYQIFSSLSLAVYAVNLIFMWFIIQFIMNRQMWDK